MNFLKKHFVEIILIVALLTTFGLMFLLFSWGKESERQAVQKTVESAGYSNLDQLVKAAQKSQAVAE